MTRAASPPTCSTSTPGSAVGPATAGRRGPCSRPFQASSRPAPAIARSPRRSARLGRRGLGELAGTAPASRPRSPRRRSSPSTGRDTSAPWSVRRPGPTSSSRGRRSRRSRRSLTAGPQSHRLAKLKGDTHVRAGFLDLHHDRARDAPLTQDLRGGALRPRNFGASPRPRLRQAAAGREGGRGPRSPRTAGAALDLRRPGPWRSAPHGRSDPQGRPVRHRQPVDGRADDPARPLGRPITKSR